MIKNPGRKFLARALFVAFFVMVIPLLSNYLHRECCFGWGKRNYWGCVDRVWREDHQGRRNKSLQVPLPEPDLPAYWHILSSGCLKCLARKIRYRILRGRKSCYPEQYALGGLGCEGRIEDLSNCLKRGSRHP
jgi:hypothetical protein